MYVPKLVLAIFPMLTALALGWVLHAVIAEAGQRHDFAASEPARLASDHTPSLEPSPPPVIHLTIVNEESAAANDSTVQPVVLSMAPAQAPGTVAVTPPVSVSPDASPPPSAASMLLSLAPATPPRLLPDSWQPGRSRLLTPAVSERTPSAGDTLPAPEHATAPAVASPDMTATSSIAIARSPVAVSGAPQSPARDRVEEQRHAAEPVNSGQPRDAGGAASGLTVNMFGTRILIASDGAIVFIGDDGVLNANTGDVAAGGASLVSTTGSEVVASYEGTPATSNSQASAAVGPLTTSNPAPSSMNPASALSSPVPSSASSPAAPANAARVTAGVQHANASLLSILPIAGAGSLGIAVSGFEDHSVSVHGNDQIVTYDDSNVFINRNGPINANTGDTDSSGLNVVDATYSIIRSGNSGDAEDSDDDDEEDEEDEEEEEERLAVRAGLNSGNGPAGAFSTVTDEGASTAVAHTSLVIGADGFDDVSIRSTGERNIVTYDDSNVVIGGSGPVNAQIGDSDTGGAVVMGVHHSFIQAGCEGDLCYLATAGRSGLD